MLACLAIADIMVPLGILTIGPYDAGNWPLPGVIVECVLVDTLKKAFGGTTAHKNTNKTDNQKFTDFGQRWIESYTV